MGSGPNTGASRGRGTCRAALSKASGTASSGTGKAVADDDLIRLFLCGDVMTGRGIDQALPHPCEPTLDEGYVKDARVYVKIAEEANGPIPRPVDFAYIWGDALAELSRFQPDVRLINLETS